VPSTPLGLRALPGLRPVAATLLLGRSSHRPRSCGCCVVCSMVTVAAGSLAVVETLLLEPALESREDPGGVRTPCPYICCTVLRRCVAVTRWPSRASARRYSCCVSGPLSVAVAMGAVVPGLNELEGLDRLSRW